MVSASHLGGIGVGQLLGGNLGHLRLGHLANGLLVGLAGALGDAGRLFEQHRGRRRLEDEGEAAVLRAAGAATAGGGG